METNNQNTQPEVAQQPMKTTEEPVKQISQPKKNNWLIPSLVFALIFSLGIAGIFAYQNFNMAQELANQNKLKAEQKQQEQKRMAEEIKPTSSPSKNIGTYVSPKIKYPFEISYPSNWTVEESLVEKEPNALTLTLTNQNEEMIQIIQGEGGGGSCVYYDDADYETFEGMGRFFSSYTELKKPSNWRISQPKDQNIKELTVCEKSKTRYFDITRIGWISININSEESLEEITSILESVVIKPTVEKHIIFD